MNNIHNYCRFFIGLISIKKVKKRSATSLQSYKPKPKITFGETTHVVLSRLKTKKDDPISYQYTVQKPESVMYDGAFVHRAQRQHYLYWMICVGFGATDPVI